MLSDPVLVALSVAQILESCGLRYLVGGSLASSTSVEKPAYTRGGPTVAIDEAHSNFHTAGGEYRPFADLLTADGYRIIASTRKFDRGILAGVDLLVIANARDLAALLAGDLSKPAFTEHECDIVRDWVHDGGSLLLIADHAPFGNAAESGKGLGIRSCEHWRNHDATRLLARESVAGRARDPSWPGPF